MSKVVGIDLGTTNSVVAYVNAQGKPEVIRNERGRTLTPSVIYFGSDTPIIGDEAKEQQKAGKSDVVSLFKRTIDDENFLFTAHGHDYSFIDFSALVLRYMKAQAERVLKEQVTAAVITVPAYFTDPQRSATKKAGEQAGLHVLKIISEPTAAAIAYSATTQERQQFMLVYDLGGGTFDVSLVSLQEDELRIRATDGNNRLGGADWDARLLKHVIQQFERDHAITITDAETRALYNEVEQAKHVLSVRPRASIKVQARNMAATYTIQRTEFEELTRDLMEETQLLTERLLRTAGITRQDVTSVLLVGGASKMPMVRTYVERLFGKAPVSISPEEIVALGAALQAEQEIDQQHADTRETIDVIAHGLGMIVESNDGSSYLNSIIIPKNSPIPAKQTRTYQKRIRPDGKTQLEIFVTQGESTNPQYCEYQGRYLFTDFPSVAGGSATLDVTYQYDKNGIVQVSALERMSQQPLKLFVETRPTGARARFAGRPVVQARQERLTLYLAVDLSGSMKGEPLEKAKQEMHAFVEQCNLATVSIGVLSFADNVSLNLQATQDKQAITRTIEQLEPNIRLGFANNGDPFDELYIQLSQVEGLRYAIVLTDGAWACPEKAVHQAQHCHSARIEVCAIGFGAARSDFLSRIASSAERGVLTDLHHLTNAFSTIAQEIAERTEGDVSFDKTKE